MAKRLLWALTVISVTLALTSPAEARRKRGRKGSMALFPITGDNKRIITEVNRMLEPALRETGIPMISGPVLKRRLKAAPAQAAERCLGNPTCLGKLGKKARTELVVVGVCTATGSGAMVAFQVISNWGRIEREATIEITSVADTRDALASSFETLFYTPPPSTLAGTDALAAMGDLDLMPLEPVAETPTDAFEPEPAEDPLALISLPQLKDPLEDDPDIEPTPEHYPLGNDPNSIAAVDPAVSTTMVEPSEPSEPSRWLFYTSIALAGGAALVAGGGGYFGVRSMLTVNEANGDMSINQIRAGEMRIEAGNHAARATLLYAIGGALAATAGVLFAVDLVLTPEIQPTMLLSADGASAGVRYSF